MVVPGIARRDRERPPATQVGRQRRRVRGVRQVKVEAQVVELVEEVRPEQRDRPIRALAAGRCQRLEVVEREREGQRQCEADRGMDEIVDQVDELV